MHCVRRSWLPLPVVLAIFLLCATKGEALVPLSTDGWSRLVEPVFRRDAALLAAKLLNQYRLHRLIFSLGVLVGASRRRLQNGLHEYAVTVEGVCRWRAGGLIAYSLFVQIRFILTDGQFLGSVPPSAVPREKFYVAGSVFRRIYNQIN
ncbi:hypothetical protein AXF42_Ash006724 [Apostasia shenzhenica]|uniref:Uncharacterized protein n=1 Tax=Apostasia shenzhenica TaxID=1088818 RepID=A0A2I0AIX6_9ASPA|nr:hypothetical protein AXF42_Ash006724 [Apostasia shenzhenica]